jgi:hypothetical protein
MMALPSRSKTVKYLFITAAILALVVLYVVVGSPADYREISLSELRDKIEGGWAGQMIGVSYGAPTEFKYNSRIIPEEELPEWSAERLSNAIHQDDLYVDMTFAQVLDEKGLDASTEDFGKMFRDAKYHLWHANLAARRALKRGVPAGKSGTPEFNAHANDIDFQIEADFIGLMSPGLPQASNEICDRAGRVMNYGDGIYGGMFVSGMYAAAFFEKDPRKIVEAGLACIPAESPYGLLIGDVLKWSAQHPDDWIQVWRQVEDKWNKREPCPAGALKPFNIDAKINGAYIAIGLLYGRGDMGETIKISTRCGQDSDCNPSNAAGILGVVMGYEAIPDYWKSGIDAIADKTFSYTNFTFHTIVDSTLKRAVELVKRNGGKLEGETLTVRLQEPKAPPLEIWDDYGSPVERISVDDPRWSFSGDWEVREGSRWKTRFASEKGAEAEISFEGTGAIIVGPYLPTGGTADVYLNGELHRTVDVYPDEDHTKGDEAVWHSFTLQPGRHTLRLVVRGEPFADSKGTQIALDSLVVFNQDAQ